MVVWMLCATAWTAAPDYARQVQPILQKYCVGCHTPDDPNGELVMTDFARLSKGGKSGPAFVAGKSSDSRMIRMVEGSLKPKMPPKGNPIPTAAEVAVLRSWIDAGAKGPSTASVEMKRLPTVQSRRRVKPSVGGLAWSPKGDLLAVAVYGKVLLVDAKTGYSVRELAGIPRQVTSVRYSADGKQVAAAGGEAGRSGVAVLWNVADGRRIREFSGHRDALYALDLSRDGRLLTTAGYDRDIRLWNASTGELVRTLTGHNDAVYGLAFSPDGRKLASASGDRTVKLWDVAKGARLDTFSQPLQEQFAVAFRPDGLQLAAAGGDNRIRLWRISADGAEGSNPLLEARFAHDAPILQLAYSADGRQLATSAQDSTVKLWDAEGVAARNAFEQQPDWPTAIVFSPNGKTLAVGRHDGTVAAYETSSYKRLRELPLVPAPTATPKIAAVSPRGVQRGVETRLNIGGSHLDGHGLSVRCNATDVAFRVVSANPGEAVVSIAPAAGRPRGPISLFVETAAGKSNELPLLIDDLPQVELKKNASEPVRLPAGVWGVVGKPGDAPSFTFEATKGQQIVFDVESRRLGAKLHAMLTITDQDGAVVASAGDYDGEPDPLLFFNVPRDGRYLATVSDSSLSGSPQHYFRVTAGSLPYVTGAFPLGVATKSTTSVQLLGANLASMRTPALQAVSPNDPGEFDLKLDPGLYRMRRPIKLVADAMPVVVESEPNDGPENATPMQAPGVADGRIFPTGIGQSTDVDHFRFHSRKGESWIIETVAAQRGSPVDTRIEVLDESGKPIQRLQLQAVRDAAVHFRNIDSRSLEIRTTNWMEMELNQYLYMGGEVGRYFRLPQGPDSAFLFYGRDGVRLTYFDTSATAHALNDPIYIVEPRPNDAKLAPNGLPVFPVYYANDDSGDRKIGRDSRLTFIAPADADYVVRVADSRGLGGERFAYRLVVRRPAPDFRATLSVANASVGAGTGREVRVAVDRIDGFDGPVAVSVAGLPMGFHVSNPTVIEAGHYEAKMVVFADPNAPAPDPKAPPPTATASATIGAVVVVRSAGTVGPLKLAPRPRFTVKLEPAEIVIPPGGTVAATLSVVRHGFNDRIRFQFENLPHGVFVDNIGLNGILIRPGETTRQVYLTARPWVQPMSRPFFALAEAEGNIASPPLLLHVRGPHQVAGAK